MNDDSILQEMLRRHKQAFQQGFFCGVFATIAAIGLSLLIWRVL